MAAVARRDKISAKAMAAGVAVTGVGRGGLAGAGKRVVVRVVWVRYEGSSRWVWWGT